MYVNNIHGIQILNSVFCSETKWGSHYCYQISLSHYYSAAWQVMRNALYFSVFKVMQILASLQVDQRFSVQVQEMPSQFFQHSKSTPPYTEKYITNEAKKQLANLSWLGWTVILLLFHLWQKGNRSWLQQIPSAQWPCWLCNAVEVTSLKRLAVPSRSGWQMIGSAVVSYSGPTQTL